jgi:hypothetical protein
VQETLYRKFPDVLLGFVTVIVVDPVVHPEREAHERPTPPPLIVGVLYAALTVTVAEAVLEALWFPSPVSWQ